MLLSDLEQIIDDTLRTQDDIGVQISVENEVPLVGPINKGLWIRTDNTVVVFADMKRSTALNLVAAAKQAARAYTYFIKAAAQIADRFEARYLDIQGDAMFALFSGPSAVVRGLGCAITIRTFTETLLKPRLGDEGGWELACGIGMDAGAVLVRRLGLRGTKENEVWAGKPVSMAAHLSGLAGPTEVVVSQRIREGLTSGANALQRR